MDLNNIFTKTFPTERVFILKSENKNYYNLKSADWQGQKMKISGWPKCAFDTEAEALKYYQQKLTDVQDSLRYEITRVQSYIDRYEDYKLNPPNKKKKKTKSNIAI